MNSYQTTTVQAHIRLASLSMAAWTNHTLRTVQAAFIAGMEAMWQGVQHTDITRERNEEWLGDELGGNDDERRVAIRIQLEDFSASNERNERNERINERMDGVNNVYCYTEEWSYLQKELLLEEKEGGFHQRVGFRNSLSDLHGLVDGRQF